MGTGGWSPHHGQTVIGVMLSRAFWVDKQRTTSLRIMIPERCKLKRNFDQILSDSMSATRHPDLGNLSIKYICKLVDRDENLTRFKFELIFLGCLVMQSFCRRLAGKHTRTVSWDSNPKLPPCHKCGDHYHLDNACGYTIPLVDWWAITHFCVHWEHL